MASALRLNMASLDPPLDVFGRGIDQPVLADLAVPKIEGVVDGDVPGRRDDAINWRTGLCDLSMARLDLLSWHGLPAAVS